MHFILQTKFNSVHLCELKFILFFFFFFQVCYKLFDELMNQMNSPIFSDMTNAVEIIAGPECASLQVSTSCTNAFSLSTMS